MNEWSIVTVIIALVGLFITIGSPIIKLNANITKLNASLDAVQTRHSEDEKRNQDAHKEIWERSDKHDETLAEHAMRLHDLDGK